ncbi:hypothetical protein E6H15_05470 [Candidatus Bathyarchaeota archaeon]|nr:MAG: hypothetical protein E6H22_00650 [Candidatus Bathyarchaeota archaeon]TMI54731.1 MAG: hypothetical protein E6H15_05470 [Candidatus Bathyarchaeota archaeon]
MQATKSGVEIARESHRLFGGIVAAIGSVWTSRRAKKPEARKVRLVSWASRANTDSWFKLQIEQSKSRGLYYYTRNQAR